MAERFIQPHYYPQLRQRHTDDAEVGCTVGCTVGFTSVFLTAVAFVTALLAGWICSQDPFEGSNDDKAFATSVFRFAYPSAFALLFSVIVEHIYVFIMIGRVVCSTEHDLPTSGWRRRFWIVLPLYWVLFVISETFLIIAIKGLHHREPRAMLFFLAMFVDGLAMAFTACLHTIAGKIYFRVLLHDRIKAQLDALPNVYESAEEVCIICIESLTDGDVARELSCGHSFHTSCIDRWLLTKPLCPHCRRGI